MAQSWQTTEGLLLTPGGYASFRVQPGSQGLAATGILMIVGEADAGPDYTLEADISLNTFGPTQFGDVVKKYKSGPLVDLVRACAQPSSDPQIPGAPASFLLVKTNPSTKASSVLSKVGGGTYGSLYDKSWGKLGNLIFYSIAQKTAEVMPTTGTFTYIPPVGTVAIGARVNGGTEVSRTGITAESPTAFVAGVTALTGISATGGVNRAALSSTHGSLAVGGIVGNQAVFTLSVIANWDTTPTVGDTLVIPAGSAIAGAGNANVGGWVIQAVSSTTITATKLSDAAKPGAVIGTITAPAIVAATPVIGANLDLVAYSPVAITLSSATVVDGVSKTLEINQLVTGTDLLNRTAFQLGTVTPVTWVSATGAPAQLTNSAEYQVVLTTGRQVDSAGATSPTIGGNTALLLGYTGTTCAVAITATTITMTMTGGAGVGLSPVALNFKDYPTLNDLATYINSLAGFKCAVASSTLGQQSSLILDEGNFTAGSDFGNMTLRLKTDAVNFFQAVTVDPLVQLGGPLAAQNVPAAAGLPAVQATSVFLAGAVRGGTTDAIFNAAVDTLEACQGNFLVPTFSRDAATGTTNDITDGLTDSTSSYTIANIQAYSKTHVLKMSNKKRRRHRQAGLANRGTLAAAKQAAGTLATEKAWLAFQDVLVTGANGIVQQQPWMGAGLAAAMQAAGGYRAIFAKNINCNGFVQAAGDFNPANDDQRDAALQAGLLIGRKNESGGGFSWVSDQTTYTKDNNFVYNSIQAVYGANTIARTLGQRMQAAMVGQSVADVGAAQGLAALEAIMADLLRLKLTAPSDDQAPKGYKNVRVALAGPVASVQLEVKLSGAIYFCDIDFLVTQVQQTATT